MTEHQRIKTALLEAGEKLHKERNKQNLDAFNKYKQAYNISLINLTIKKLMKP